MSIKGKVLIASMSLCLFSMSALSDDNKMKKYGVEKQTADTYNSHTDTYKKEFDKDYGAYGSSTREFKNSEGERDTSANEREGGGSYGVGGYKDF